MRLIDADEIPWCEYDLEYYHPFVGVDKVYVDEMPTVDAELVRYGEWVPQDETYTKFMCSECNSKNYEGYEKYCPNCGAKMKWDGMTNEYAPTCKFGYADCIRDPAYIKHEHPEWYTELYGDVDPSEVDDCYDCKNGSRYDDEDK